MKSLFVLTLVAIFCINNIQTTDLLLGNTVGAQLAYMENVSLASVPFTVRVKNVFYNNDRNLPIKAISAMDLDKSKARVIVSSGGVGFNFVNLNFRSERGSGLHYQVSIYV